MSNPRPERCPHLDCAFINSLGQGAFCKGKLPKPIDHDGQDNTHRLCFLQFDGEVYDFQMNKGDMWQLHSLLEPKEDSARERSDPETTTPTLNSDKEVVGRVYTEDVSDTFEWTTTLIDGFSMNHELSKYDDKLVRLKYLIEVIDPDTSTQPQSDKEGD